MCDQVEARVRSGRIRRFTLIFPDDRMRARLAVARDITSGERREFARRWNGIVGL